MEGGGVEKIKVLVANRPRLMRELVMATISDQPDIEIVGVLEDETSIMEMVEQSHPEFLIIALDHSDERPHICDALLDRFPRMRILALAAERDSSISYWVSLDIRSSRIENSEDGILNALRGRQLPVAPGPTTEHRSRTN
jgi:AmiR/NasT family two-component response regulator